jgi:hypothetical protein
LIDRNGIRTFGVTTWLFPLSVVLSLERGMSAELNNPLLLLRDKTKVTVLH